MSVSWPEGMPKEIRVGHITYTVHIDVDEIGTDEEMSEDQMGATFHKLRAIWILTEGTTLDQQQNTLLHEVLHVCVDNSGLVTQGRGRDGTEEVYISAITTPLHGILIDNPDLTAWLLAGYRQRHLIGTTL